MAATQRRNITDRGLRYRANRAIPEHPKVCAFCGKKDRPVKNGSRPLLEVGHVNGDEADTSPANLTWTCRPCNVIAANTLRNANKGRLTNQYNPTKGGGAANVKEYTAAVGAIVPRESPVDGRGDRGALQGQWGGTVASAVALLAATPHAARSRFAAILNKNKSGRRAANPTRQNWPWSRKEAPQRSTHRSGLKSQMTHARAMAAAKKAGYRSQDEGEFSNWLEAKRLEDRQAATIGRIRDAYFAGVAKRDQDESDKEARKDRVKADALNREFLKRTAARSAHRSGRGSSTRYKGYTISRTDDGEFYSSLDPQSWYDTAAQVKRAIDSYEKGRRNPKGGLIGKAKKLLKGAGRAGLKTYDTLTGIPRKIAGKIINPSQKADEVFEEFHGYAPEETVTVRKQVHHHTHLAAAGELVRLVVDGVDGYRHTIRNFGGAILAFNETKNQLFIEGGDQAIDLRDFRIKQPHELETLGKVRVIDYQTNKTHLGSEGGEAVYTHRFRSTNKDGQHVLLRVAKDPDLIYDVPNQQLVFSGGSYEIRAEGIDR